MKTKIYQIKESFKTVDEAIYKATGSLSLYKIILELNDDLGNYGDFLPVGYNLIIPVMDEKEKTTKRVTLWE